MTRFTHYIKIVIGTLVACAVLIAVYGWDYYDTPGPLTTDATILFERGVGFQGIVTDLNRQGVIDNPLLFATIALALGSHHQFKAGEYNFPAGATPHQIMSMIAQGKVVIHKITVIEGRSVRDTVKSLIAEPALEGDMPASIKEGSLLPETYHFTRGEKRADVVVRMQTAMNTTLDALWQKRNADVPLQSPEEALVLASIVERETGLPDERPHVASVFVNRLRIGMRLQSDPTVVYGIEHKSGAPLGRALTTADLQEPTPYNTYVNVGLPPTPIANPGRASLQAVLNPLDTKDLYFVATGSGGHHFASTLEQHNRNVAEYRQKLARTQ